jgi:hypothetical protein
MATGSVGTSSPADLQNPAYRPTHRHDRRGARLRELSRPPASGPGRDSRLDLDLNLPAGIEQSRHHDHGRGRPDGT